MDQPLTIKQLLNPNRTMTLTYVISLALIAGLSIFVHFTLDKIILEQTTSAKLINISGKQRMLSQRIALYTNNFIAQGKINDQQQANIALNKMQSNHQYLLKGHFEALAQQRPSPLSAPIQALYFSPPHAVDQKIAEFSLLIKQALDNPSATQKSIEELTYLSLAEDQMLNSFNTVVQQYETQSIQKIQALRTTQKLVMIIIVLTVIIEALFVIWPLLTRSDKHAKNLQKEANHDYLTDLLNRRSFTILAQQSIAMSQRYNSSLSVISVDIDHFKSINDQYGHDLGDKVIQTVANTIKNTCRDSDSVFRFGGEEFLILLPQTSLEQAIKLAEKIRNTIANSPTFSNKLIIEITASSGVAQWDNLEVDLENTLKRADKALYQAKQQGRDQVISG